MALIVEDGSKVANAESYVDVTEADAYWAARNDTVWSGKTSGEKEAALREAALYLDMSYRWIGSPTYYDQVMKWPRSVGYDRGGKEVSHDEIPLAVRRAQMELAYAALSGNLAPTLERGGQVQNETVGPLSVTYFEGAPGGRRYAFADLILKDLITGRSTGLTGRAVRG